MITSKENCMMVLEHKKPEWVPSCSEMIMCGGAQETFENGPLTVIGGYDTNGKPAQPTATVEEIQAEVRRAIDTYAPYGSYMFFGFMLVDTDNAAESLKAMMPMFEEAGRYGRSFYTK